MAEHRPARTAGHHRSTHLRLAAGCGWWGRPVYQRRLRVFRLSDA